MAAMSCGGCQKAQSAAGIIAKPLILAILAMEYA
jgi:hypothetical protein